MSEGDLRAALSEIKGVLKAAGIAEGSGHCVDL